VVCDTHVLLPHASFSHMLDELQSRTYLGGRPTSGVGPVGDCIRFIQD